MFLFLIGFRSAVEANPETAHSFHSDWRIDSIPETRSESEGIPQLFIAA